MTKNKQYSWVLTLAALLLAPTLYAQRAQEVDHENVQILPGKLPVPTARAELAKARELIVAQTNAFRGDEGLSAVREDTELSLAAEYFALFMARTGKYGHTADGKQPAERAAEHGYKYCIVLENIAYLYRSGDFNSTELARDSVEVWKNSPGHRQNMLDPDIQHTGVAVARSAATGYYFAVQMFGRPASAAIGFSITNRTSDELKYGVQCAHHEKSHTLPPWTMVTHRCCRPPKIKVAPVGDKDEQLIPVSGGERLLVTREGRLKAEGAE